MVRKINSNIFLRFQTALGLENSDGSMAGLTEGVQPVVDISPQIQDSLIARQTDSLPGSGTINLSHTCPDDRSYNIKRISIFASHANGTIDIQQVIGSTSVTIAFLNPPAFMWQFIDLDVWLNPGESLNIIWIETTGAACQVIADISGLQYTGVG